MGHWNSYDTQCVCVCFSHFGQKTFFLSSSPAFFLCFCSFVANFYWAQSGLLGPSPLSLLFRLFTYHCLTSSFSPVDAHSALKCSRDGKQGVKLRRRGGGGLIPSVLSISSQSVLVNNFMLPRISPFSHETFPNTHTPTIHICVHTYCTSTPTGRHEAPPLGLCLVCDTCCSPLCFLGLVS